MKCVNLNNETLEILGVHFSYNKNLEQDKKFSEQIVKIENILNLWRMIQLTLKGRIKLFKSLAISKVIHLLLITKFHNTVKPLNSAHLRFLKRLSVIFGAESFACYSRDVRYLGCLLLGVFTVIQLMLCTKY